MPHLRLLEGEFTFAPTKNFGVLTANDCRGVSLGYGIHANNMVDGVQPSES